MQLLGNLKIHFLALVLTVVAEFIGIKKLGPVVLLPLLYTCLLYTSPSPRDYAASRMPSSA